jgi:predicted DNA-binding transcriptional regulator AlpA
MTSIITEWDQLPRLLDSSHMRRLFMVSGKTIDRWVRSRQIPQPIISGRIRGWDRDVVRQHLERLQREANKAGAALAILDIEARLADERRLSDGIDQQASLLGESANGQGGSS